MQQSAMCAACSWVGGAHKEFCTERVPSMLTYQSDAAYCDIVPHVLTSEGRYVNQSTDPGGPTMFGIAWNYNAPELQALGLTHDTMQKLTVEQARQIYYQKYWQASHADKIADKRLAYLHFDTAVNCGVGEARKIFALLAPTISAGDRFVDYVAARLDYYTHCRSRGTYLEGWDNRLISVMRTAMSWPAVSP